MIDKMIIRVKERYLLSSSSITASTKGRKTPMMVMVVAVLHHHLHKKLWNTIGGSISLGAQMAPLRPLEIPNHCLISCPHLL
jgi:hypothetical protein